MNFMKSWEQWSQKQWDTWGSKLQGRYDGIKAWKFTKEQNDMLADILSFLPSAVQTYMSKLLMCLYQLTLKKKGKEAVIETAEKMSSFINTFVYFLKK